MVVLDDATRLHGGEQKGGSLLGGRLARGLHPTAQVVFKLVQR